MRNIFKVIESWLPHNRQLLKALEIERGSKLSWEEKLQVMKDSKDFRKATKHVKPKGESIFNRVGAFFKNMSKTAKYISALSAAVMFGIISILASSLLGGGWTRFSGELPINSEPEIIYRTAEHNSYDNISDFYSDMEPYLFFNQEKAEIAISEQSYALCCSSKDGENTRLAYVIDGISVNVISKEVIFMKVDFMVRLEEGYQFSDYEDYTADKLAKSFCIDDLKNNIVNFAIQKTIPDTSGEARIHFEYHGIDYFIYVAEMVDLNNNPIDITPDKTKLLVESLF